MIVIEFGGNTLAEANRDANTLQNPEKPVNGDFANHLNSTNCRSQAEKISNQYHEPFFAILRRWIEENLLKN